VAGALRGDHDHVDVGARHDLVVMHVEAVGKSQRRALLHVRLDCRSCIRQGMFSSGNRIMTTSAPLTALATSSTLRPPLRLVPGSAALAQTNGDLDAGILQVLGVGMALRAVTNDGDLLALDQGEVGVLVVINFHGILFLYR
jgi:hypothetical protein